MKKFFQDGGLMSALIFLILLAIVGFTADNIACGDCWIPFDPMEFSYQSSPYSPPGTKEVTAEGLEKTHIFGTDQIGRDVASRLVHGISVALNVGIWSSLVALIIGLILGCLSGYAGDRTHRLSIVQILGLIVGLLLAHFYASEWAYELDRRDVFVFRLWRYLCASLLLWVLTYFFVNLLGRFFRVKEFWVPWDTIVIKGIEVFRSIPRLFFLLAIFAIVTRPSLWSVIFIIGFIRWPALARLIRAEIINVKQEDYIRNVQLLGLPGWRILMFHVLPNIYKPMVILTAFNMGSAILIEATLSFLQIGLPIDAVSWGRMLGDSRGYIPAWWMAVGPGLLIFSLILSFNVIGSRLSYHFGVNK